MEGVRSKRAVFVSACCLDCLWRSASGHPKRDAQAHTKETGHRTEWVRTESTVFTPEEDS